MIEEAHVTAMICEDLGLLVKVQSILSSMGKQLGEDISVICVEHVKGQGAKMLPKIDCYYVPSLELGETIATELLNQLSGKKEYRSFKKIHAGIHGSGICQGNIKQILERKILKNRNFSFGNFEKRFQIEIEKLKMFRKKKVNEIF